MKLRYQLLLVSLLLLVLPWSAWQYLAAFDVAARASQAEGLIDQARLIANRLSIEEHLFAQDFIQSRHDATTVYAHGLNSPPIVDGYSDDWRNYDLPVNTIPEKNIQWQLAADQQQFYFFLQVKDDAIHYFNPSLGELTSGDRLEVHVITNEEQLKNRHYVLQTSAPGTIAALTMSGEQSRFTPEINAVWQETRDGYQIEMAIDRSVLIERFQIRIVDEDGEGEKIIPLSSEPFTVVTPSLSLSQFLRTLYSDGTYLSVLNRDQWLVAEIKPAYNVYRVSETPWIIEWFYRRLLASENLPARQLFLPRSYVDYKELSDSISEGSALRWYRGESGPLRSQTLASVAVPIIKSNGKGSRLGFVVLEKNTDQLIALTASAFNQLFIYSIGGLLVVMLALLFYASWLSMRIRRLNRAANDVIGEKGDMRIKEYPWPDLQRSDELADLSKGYRKLLLRVQEYNDYLRSLSNKLSHELRTPIAVVKSSLENLEEVKEIDKQHTYHQRAQQGITRLDSILQAMSSANRIEESLANAEFELTDLNDFFESLCFAYNDVYSQHQITFKSEIKSLQEMLSQELFVQMVDKLIDNAASFSSPNDPIVITLSAGKNYWQLSVENTGPLLPDDMRGQLFDSMVSLRKKESTEATHLGLGLYIVRLVSELHKGTVCAENREDGSGVIFCLQLPMT